MLLGNKRNKFGLPFLNPAPLEQSDMMYKYNIAEFRSFFSFEGGSEMLSIDSGFGTLRLPYQHELSKNDLFVILHID